MLAWGEFCRGKRKAKDVQKFERNLADNLLALHEELKNKTYRHGGYYQFKINDPKPRVIHKASVKDRLVHHAIYRKLYPFFDRKFIFDSYSCRNKKGTHKAMNRFRHFAHRLSRNNTRTVWVLKGDIRKFFDNIDHEILLNLLCYSIVDKDILCLLENVISSFSTAYHSSCDSRIYDIGLPLGNLTSQLLVNIYMNEFDQFVKDKLKIEYYIRYADDFVILYQSKVELEQLIPKITEFLREHLRLKLHPEKTFIQTFASGVDFLGWVHFSGHRVLRSAAKRRILRTIRLKPEPAVIESYRGLLRHGNAVMVLRQLENAYWLNQLP